MLLVSRLYFSNRPFFILFPFDLLEHNASKYLFYLTKFQIKPFQLHVTKMRLVVSIGREVGILLHILYVDRS